MLTHIYKYTYVNIYINIHMLTHIYKYTYVNTHI